MQPGDTNVRALMIFLKPHLPQTAERTEAFLGVEPYSGVILTIC